MNKPRIAIIYLCHNDIKYVPDVVDSWGAQSYPQELISIVMIPNGAKDGAQDLIKNKILPRSKKDLPEIIMIDDGVNRGFAGGNNIGIKWAMARGFDYVFLNNGDLKLGERAVEELVDLMELDLTIGSAQSFVKLWQDKNKVNTTGGVIHVAGFGYARDNGKSVDDVKVQDGEEIIYASGASAIYRVSALKKVGLLEEGFFMYHEDLELGLRLRFAGYKNVLSTKSQVFHNYSFSRNPKKFQWMETYRIVVLLSYLKFRSFLVLTPILVIVECGIWLLSIKGKWFGSKFLADIELCKPKTWKLIANMRSRAQKLRVIKDQDWMRILSSRIEDQEVESLATRIGNSVITLMWKIILPIIRW
ncbi:glycosyltransferase family 2 protein [Candidatus Parcubacteria bacterium]|nr:glycosyltransferase family 2 protein [Candidatus Parcubacteria bacterium]